MYRIIVLAYLIRGLTGYEELIGQKRVNPEVYMNVSQMISHQGYPSEEYKVLTEDGYYLTINRIPWGRKDIADIDGKPVVFLQHGIFGEASHWVENMANNSLGFILADENCDVWLGNSRGTSWSQRHRSFSVDQEDFWNFSFHEMAMYDLPATINFILKKTKKKQLYYVGHSQGATIGFIAFSAMPELSHKIKMFLALAPVIYVTHVPDLLLRLLASFPQHLFKQILGNKDFMFTHKPMKYFMKNLCTIEFMHQLCSHLIFLPGTYNATNLNMSRIDVYAAHYPDRTSVKTVLHWKQILDTEMFRYFDYGNKNQMIYKQNVPPSYQIKDMVVPTAVWSGGQDPIADPEDIKLLISHIVNLVYHRSWSDWTHLDFIWGLNARERLFFKIIQLIKMSM
ncbi:lysosomal acid lipase/cholesteryl ester hydrolase-like isoform X1 [Crotalus tigris]|uniref:lysosomal acid lipase/cholesteryl ester hydrolase-like isoform X1 n=1 Tax=Crotalus tigris TaxID=88082 RepID=UPI00192F2CEE|nr:lysosomal acid lipase/cholesteryl ester hydrolase-like isoform X1 [Crotalus tigris]